MAVSDVIGGFRAQRVVLPASTVESWTVIGRDLRPVPVLDEYLAWLTHIERSPNTVEAQARDLRMFWSFLGERGLGWEGVDVQALGELIAWARCPAENVVVLHERAARRSSRTVNRVLSSIVGFYEFQGRRGTRWRRIWSRRRAMAMAAISVSGGDRAAAAAWPCGAAARAAAVAADVELGAGGGSDRLPATSARPLPVRAAGEHRDADRSGAGVAP